jgi:hypothetical protein
MDARTIVYFCRYFRAFGRSKGAEQSSPIRRNDGFRRQSRIKGVKPKEKADRCPKADRLAF